MNILDLILGGKAKTSATPSSSAPRPTAGKAARDVPAPATERPMTVGDRQRMAQRPPSFTEMLPYVTYSPGEQVFVMRDGATWGAMFELDPVATEAQPLSYLQERCDKVREAITALPESDTTPWIVQWFVNDDRNIEQLQQHLHDYVLSQHKDNPARGQEVINSAYTQSVLQEFRKHLEQASRPQGLFTDTQVTGQVWRGQQRRVRCCIYRKFTGATSEPGSPQQQMEAVATTLMATFNEAGIAARRCDGKDFYEWLLPFFNRDVPWAPTPGELLKTYPYPGPKPATMFDWDLAESLSLSQPRADHAGGYFEFDGIPVKALTLQNMRSEPSIGHFSAETQTGKESFAKFDRLPAGSMLSMTVVISRQDQVEQQITRIRDKSRAHTPQAMETHAECERVLHHMIGNRDKLFPMMMTLYLTGRDKAELDKAVTEANALLGPSGLRFIDPRQDLVPLDTFMRALPFNFDVDFDKKYLSRSRLTFASHIAALMPVYGRSRGTPHPGFWFWNRGGEPLWIDPLNKRDRKKNAHMLTLGPTGAGKSATLNYLAMMTMAIHRPRMVIVDAGESFDLLVADMAAKGLSVHRVTLSPDCQESLPPFVHGFKLLEDQDIMGSYHAAEERARASAGVQVDEAADGTPLMASVENALSTPALAPAHPPSAADAETEDDEEDEKRDYLGEMLISAILMITGGEKAEVDRMSRADRYLVSRAIIRAAVRAKEEQRKHPLTQDVALELMGMQRDPSLSSQRQSRAEDMGQAMMSFTMGLRGTLFNSYGGDWPDADVTLVEMGTLTKDGYSDALALAYSSLIDSVQSRGEKYQAEGRPLVKLTDEGHLITTNELLGPKLAKATKMWRKLSIWFWLATQNLRDFPDSMERVLSMCEFWMLLTMDKSEIQEVARFRNLTPEQRAMMESAKKEPPKYTEGVLISALGQWLFRNVPPALPIALAMTEGHEKAQRRRIMEEHGCSMVEAAYKVAEQLAEARA
ncbi:conjugative transfer ATPase [Delftia acidovorans CCUG 274B]|uniref:conjugative transfer ATPase n=1 Tax=Delftia acidovorans TaxID=80866 RepID=UPI00035487C2|nr:conjugative transfer ATPase [Delftia acidovorans]EPD42967.1 conjugative transfer ATPase [Delftia acidovorans CCUG 274B]